MENNKKNTTKQENALTVKLTAAQEKAIAEIKEKTAITLTNGKLATLTLEIAKLLEVTTMNYNKLGGKLETVQTEKLYKADFGTFAKYVESVFGLKKSAAYNAIKVHKQLYTTDGKQFAENTIGLLNDTQLLALTNIDGDNTTPENAEKIAVEIGVAKNDTARQIAEKVKAYKESKTETAETAETETAETETKTAEEIAADADYTIAVKAITTAVNKIMKIKDTEKRGKLILHFTTSINAATKAESEKANS